MIDLTDQHFGRLTAIRRVDSNSKKGGNWLCICECGNYTMVRSNNLRGGNTKSCGCLRREKSRRRALQVDGVFSKQNSGDISRLTNEYGVSYSAIHLSTRNKSGVIGVSYDKRRKVWFARLYFHGHYVLNKSFLNFQDAVKARKQAELDYYHLDNVDK